MQRALTLVLPLTVLLAACGSEAETPPSAAPVDQPVPVAGAESAAPPAAPVAVVGARPAAFAQCITCHAVEPGRNGIGPSLAGVFGAKAGHVATFAYSTPMRNSGLTWDEATLDSYLKNPREVVPGTKMAYAGLKDDAKRAELVAWLKTI